MTKMKEVGNDIGSPADLWGILSGPGNRVQTFFLD